MMGLIFTYLVTYGGSLAALFNPFAGFLAYVLLGILRPESAWPWSVQPGNYSRTLAIAMLAGWVLHGFGRWNLGRGAAPIAALLAYTFWAFLSGSLSPDHDLAWSYLDRLWKITLPVVVGASLINSPGRLKALAWVILLSVAYPCLEFNLDYLKGYNRLRFDGYASLDNNGYAVALVSTAGIGVFLAMYAETRKEKLLASVSIALITHAVLLTNSRGGMLGMVIVGLTSFLLMRKGWREYSAFAAAIILVAIFTGPEVRARFSATFADKQERDESAENRIVIWMGCLDQMAKNPLLGVGPDRMPLYAPEYGLFLGMAAHTLWLQVGAELGPPALCFLIAFYTLTIFRLIPLARGSPTTDERLRLYARMVIPSLCGFMVSAQFVTLNMLESPYYVCLIGVGALKLATPARSKPRARISQPPGQSPAGATIAQGEGQRP